MGRAEGIFQGKETEKKAGEGRVDVDEIQKVSIVKRGFSSNFQSRVLSVIIRNMAKYPNTTGNTGQRVRNNYFNNSLNFRRSY